MRQVPENALLAEIIAVIGPTASGKTDLAVALARALGGEVVSADSRQIYRHLDAGTAKPKRDARGRVEGVAYHLVDFLEPSESFDAGRFARMARSLCGEIRGRGKLPIIAGGTGLYLRALLEGLSPMPGRDEPLRRRLEQEASRHGPAWLHARLSRVDAAAAQKIPAGNVQRVMRALEVYESTGRPISSFWAGPRVAGSGERRVILRIDWPAPALRERIAERAERMWPAMLRETRALLKQGFSGEEPGFESLGYKPAVRCVKGELPEEEGLRELLRSTLAYAKRQRTWFRHQVSGALPISGGTPEKMLEQGLEFIKKTRGAPILERS